MNVTSPTPPGPSNSTFKRTIALRLHSMKTTNFYPLTACGTGYIEIQTLRTKLPEYEQRNYLQKRNNWSDEVYDSIDF
jgi:hypothetical protein